MSLEIYAQMIKKKHSKNNKAKYETEKMANLQHCLKK